jgi:hypothetical protein
VKTIKVSEATPNQLNWLVVKAIYPGADGSTFWLNFARTNPHSTDWALAGPIIESENIYPTMCDNSTPEKGFFQSAKFEWKGYWRMRCIEYGPTPLIAAMRCYVAAKLGDTVEIPEDLA